LITHRTDSHLTYVPQRPAKFRTSYCIQYGVLKPPCGTWRLVVW